MPRVVTIDGPAGAGKSTAARLLAGRLGWRLLDTGAMYRAVTLAALRAGIDLESDQALGDLAGRVEVRLPPGRVMLDGEDVSGLIRSVEVTHASRYPANSPSVRTCLVDWQRRFAAENNVVAEGRDQGTIVFPDAPRKFFLTASPEERARRRHTEFLARGEAIDPADVLRDLIERDARDAARAIAPMRPAADALVIDTNGMDLNWVVNLIERAVLDPDADAWLQGDQPAFDGRNLIPPRYFAGLWVAWNRQKTRIIAVAATIDAARHAASETDEAAPNFDNTSVLATSENCTRRQKLTSADSVASLRDQEPAVAEHKDQDDNGP
ncbi:MAG: (d)CMP kinase [Isosphaeraceae bacterium]